MGRFIVNGGAPLFGRVCVSGSKNGTLPLIFASLITNGVSRIENAPDIGDVRIALDVIRHYGARVTREGDALLINTEMLTYKEPPTELIKKLRASTYLLGAGLVRFGRAELSPFGGCNFSPRPIDMHIAAILSHGARECRRGFVSDKLIPSDISFRVPSVGATVNALILAAGTHGTSVIRGIAREPHIMTLIEYLRCAGAEIDLSGDVATVAGGSLSGATVRVEGDMIEAGTYLAASLLTGGAVRVAGASAAELAAFLAPLEASGVTLNSEDGILALGKPQKRISIVTAPHPGFPTDLQPIMAPLLSVSGGTLTERVWRERFGYLTGLAAFNIASRHITDGAEIFPSEILPATAVAPDLRGGVALLLAALAADGVSVISSAETVLRGYERLTEKLTALGAEIEYAAD